MRCMNVWVLNSFFFFFNSWIVFFFSSSQNRILVYWLNFITTIHIYLSAFRTKNEELVQRHRICVVLYFHVGERWYPMLYNWKHPYAVKPKTKYNNYAVYSAWIGNGFSWCAWVSERVYLTHIVCTVDWPNVCLCERLQGHQLCGFCFKMVSYLGYWSTSIANIQSSV